MTSVRCDISPFLIILQMKHIKKKERSSVYYTYWQYIFWIICYNKSIIVWNIAKISGYLHQSIACAQVVDGGTVFNMESSCKYIE